MTLSCHSGLRLITAVFIASWMWGWEDASAIDDSSLEVQIITGPDELSDASTGAFEFACDGAYCFFSCRINDGEKRPCDRHLEIDHDEDGEYVLDVWAADGEGRMSEAMRHRWTVDTLPLDFSRWFEQTRAGETLSTRITFASTNEKELEFECQFCRVHLDECDSFQVCESPQIFSGLEEGTYTLTVRATDGFGNSELAPSYQWDVLPALAVQRKYPPLAVHRKYPRCIVDEGRALCAEDDALQLRDRLRARAGVNADSHDQFWDPLDTEEFERRPVADDTGDGTWTDWREVASGPNHACGIRRNGTLWCWGRLEPGNRYGPWSEYPTEIEAADGRIWSDWIDVAAGDRHVCGLRVDGTLWCWGYYAVLAGERVVEGVEPVPQTTMCGMGNLVENADLKHDGEPAQVLDNTGEDAWSDWVEVDAFRDYTCGIRADDSRWCWGREKTGEIFGAFRTHSKLPTRVGPFE